MSEGQWVFGGTSASVGSPGSVVTLVDGSSFCLSSRDGDIIPGTPQGLFFLDTRFLSTFALRIDGQRTEEIAMASELPFSGTFVGLLRPPPRAPEGSIAVFRRRFAGHGLVERIVVRNYDLKLRQTTVSLQVDADLADLFAVKEQRTSVVDHLRQELAPDLFVFSVIRDGFERSTSVRFSHAADVVTPGRAEWHLELPPREEWELCIEVTGAVGGVPIECRHGCTDDRAESPPIEQLRAWHASIPVAESDNTNLLQALEQTADDLGALRLVDPQHPDDLVLAAGAPWFMTLFGRDSLLASYMALIADQRSATGVLRTLARLQGRAVDPTTEEQPGRILHEIRFHDKPSASFSDGTVYYGSIDATPLFVVLLGEARRWGLDTELVDELLGHADRALEWIDHYGDRDGDGYVEYERANADGLLNQGWKDSWDGISFADGSFPQGPIALCEVQGYVYAAYRARSLLAHDRGDP